MKILKQFHIKVLTVNVWYLGGWKGIGTVNLFDDCSNQFKYFSYFFLYRELASMDAIGWTFCSLTTVIGTIINQKQKPLPDSWGLFIFVLICKWCLHVTKPDMRQSKKTRHTHLLLYFKCLLWGKQATSNCQLTDETGCVLTSSVRGKLGPGLEVLLWQER